MKTYKLKSRNLIAAAILAGLSANSLATDHPEHSQLRMSDFVYSYDEMKNFDIERYLSDNAPHLLPYSEAISHYAGYSSISPKILISAIELKSGLITTKNAAPTSIDNVFSDFSDKTSFSAQLEEVSLEISQLVYGADIQEHTPYSTKRSILTKRTIDKNQALKRKYSTLLSRVQEKKSELFNEEPPPNQHLTRSIRTPTTKKNRSKDDVRFQLPFPIGDHWWIGGSHTHTGSGSYPQSSLDMGLTGSWGDDISHIKVTAAASGVVKKHSSCYLEIMHDGGWSTTYYHLSNIQVADKTRVEANQALANYASNKQQALCNGGHSTGPHLHFSVKRDGQHIHLDGHELSRYIVHTGRHSYDSDCSYFWLSMRGAKQCAYTMFYNPGVVKPEDPGTSPEDDPDDNSVSGLYVGEVSGAMNLLTANPKQSVSKTLKETEHSIPEYTTRVFSGYLYDKDGNISFAEDIDDHARLWIDDKLVLSDDGWNRKTHSGNLKLTPGWHKFELRIGNGGGPGGKHGTLGFAVDTDGGKNWLHPSQIPTTLFSTAPKDDESPDTNDVTPPEGSLPGLAFTSLKGSMNLDKSTPSQQVVSDIASRERNIPPHTTRVFSGYIYDSDGRISFMESIDDHARLWINDKLVLNNDNWDQSTHTVNLQLAPGWHKFELRIGNGGGPGGANGAMGFGFDPDGGRNWKPLTDDGTGVLLRH